MQERLLNRGESPAPNDNLAKKRALDKRLKQSQNQSNNAPQEPKIMERTMKCCVLNGCFFWFSIIVFENIFMPFLHGLVLLFLGHTAGTTLWSNVRIIKNYPRNSNWYYHSCFTVSIVMTFIFKLTKFRASTLMNICPHKGKLKKGQKNGQNGKIKHCSEYVI